MGAASLDFRRLGPRLCASTITVLLLGAACGEIQVSDGITEVGALNTAGLAVEPTAQATPRADIALDFTSDDSSDDSEAAKLRDGREAPPDPTATPKEKTLDVEADDEEESADDEGSTRRTEIEDVEDESEVLIARGTYHADVKDGTALKVRDEPEGKQIESLTRDIAVKATGEGTTIDKITWAQIRPLGDADWDIGWVVFEHLTGGEPDVDPTPTLEPVEQAPATTAPAPTAAPSNPEPTNPPEPEPPTEEPEPEPTEEPEADGQPVEIGSMGDLYTVRGDTDLRDEADPSSSVIAVVSGGADAIIANNTGYRYDDVVYVQVNVIGVLGWVSANQLQEQ